MFPTHMQDSFTFDLCAFVASTSFHITWKKKRNNDWSIWKSLLGHICCQALCVRCIPPIIIEVNKTDIQFLKIEKRKNPIQIECGRSGHFWLILHGFFHLAANARFVFKCLWWWWWLKKKKNKTDEHPKNCTANMCESMLQHSRRGHIVTCQKITTHRSLHSQNSQAFNEKRAVAPLRICSLEYSRHEIQYISINKLSISQEIEKLVSVSLSLSVEIRRSWNERERMVSNAVDCQVQITTTQLTFWMVW